MKTIQQDFDDLISGYPDEKFPPELLEWFRVMFFLGAAQGVSISENIQSLDGEEKRGSLAQVKGELSEFIDGYADKAQ